jgi:two-component system, LuxR family, sensor kinase FixL
MSASSERSPESIEARCLDALLQATQDGVVFIDDKSRIVRANPSAERMFGYEPGKLIQQPVKVLMGEPYAREHDGYVERFEKTREPHAIGRIRVVSGRRRSGEEFPIELSVTELAPGSEGKYAAFVRDISEAVRLQNALVDRERLATVGATASMLAHEIGNPLNNLFLHAQLMQRRLNQQADPDPKIIDALETCSHEVGRLHRLLDEFRALSRREKLRKERLDLAALAADIVSHQVALKSSGRIHIERELPAGLPHVLADADKVQQVALNLLQNAAEAMPHGGTLVVRVLEERDCLVLEVSDTGVGVPDGVDVFEPFVTTKRDGTGLGLAISRQIASAHGGSLSYRRRDEGGSTFRLALPRAA